MKNYIPTVIFLLFIIILSLIYYTGYKNLYKQNLQLRLDPLEENALTGIFNHDILAIGSSSIRRWPFKELELIDNRIFNAGIDGQTSKQVLMRFERIILKHCPKYLILQVGINDIKSIGLLNSPEFIEDSYTENVKRIFSLCSDKGITAVYITNFPTGNQGILRSLIWERSNDERILKTNIALTSYCQEKDIPVFDAYKYLVHENSLKRKSEYSEDFFHLNAYGYKILNQEIEKELQKIIDRI